jgi:hypothetical protein
MSEDTRLKEPAAARSDDSSAATATRAGEAAWRRYPHIEAAIETKSPVILASIETTRIGIVQVSQTGAAREKERANTVLIAYGLVLELYQRLAGIRDELSGPISNMRGGSAISE